MTRRTRILIIALGSFGFPVAAAGAWYWWLLDAVTATDREPFIQAKAMIVLGCLMIILSLVLGWRGSHKSPKRES